MKQIHYSVNATRSAKSQALDVIRRLKDVMPIARASMALRIICNKSDIENVRKLLASEAGIVVTGEEAAEAATATQRTTYVDVLADPEVYKRLEQQLAKNIGDSCRVDVMQLRVASAAATASTGASAGASSSSSSAADDADSAQDHDGADGEDEPRQSAQPLSTVEEAHSDDEDGEDDNGETFGIVETTVSLSDCWFNA
jgi:hypothetical protein